MMSRRQKIKNAMIKNKLNVKRTVLFYLILFSGLSYCILKSSKELDILLDKEGVYSIATITYSNGKWARFSFFYRGRKVNSSTNGIKRESKYFVCFLSDLSEIYLLESIQIPKCMDSIQAPFEGWTKIPNCDSVQILKAKEDSLEANTKPKPFYIKVPR
jgi:hypothetical protein